MKAMILTVTLLAMNIASAMVTDGCYVMYKAGSMYPAFCISGSAEEGIAGSGTRVALLQTNTDEPMYCFTTSSITVDESGATHLERNGKVEMSLSVTSMANGLISGNVKLGKTELQFEQLSENLTTRYEQKISSSGICEQ